MSLQILEGVTMTGISKVSENTNCKIQLNHLKMSLEYFQGTGYFFLIHTITQGKCFLFTVNQVTVILPT